MELKEGMYVRTEYGIVSIVHIGKDNMAFSNEDVVYFDEDINDWNFSRHDYYDRNKFTFNLFSLIEVGDYVNGYKIEKIDEPCQLNPYGSLKYRSNDFDDFEQILGNEIKSIVTKEQFESMEYKIR